MHSRETDIRVVHKLDCIEGGRGMVKLEELSQIFFNQTGREPELLIRAPGRINLIGDHIDYHGFSVLPMAIENSILIGLSSYETINSTEETALLRIFNSDFENYKPFHGKHSLSYGCQLDKTHAWHNYVLCGYHGVLACQLLDLESSQVFKYTKEFNADTNVKDENIVAQRLHHNLDLLIHSDLPPASGLSSSSALVCASAVATALHLRKTHANVDKQPVNCFQIDSMSMAADCAQFEHLIGTHGGGMDQAVIMTAQEDYAKHVEFTPEFRCTNVHLPESVVWLVSHCGSNYPKAATSGFNTRVLETKLAAAIILKSLSEGSGDLNLNHTITLAQIKRQFFQELSTSDICKLLEEKIFFNANQLNIDQICSKLQLNRADLTVNFKTSEEFLVDNGLDKRVVLLKRCLHIFQEAERVEQFKKICDTTRDLRQLGKLMSESHASLRDQYECSHSDLDKLVETSLEAGALGARLTGAGWGGCIVTMVEASKCQKVRAALERVSKFTFQTEPHTGCTIIQL